VVFSETLCLRLFSVLTPHRMGDVSPLRQGNYRPNTPVGAAQP